MKNINQISDMETRDDLPFLLNRLGLVGKGIELGVCRGDFSKHLLKYWRGKKLYLIDSWIQMENYKDIANEDHNGQLNNLAQTFMNVYEYKEKAIIVRDTSKDASFLFKDNSLDFVYIDADHSYSACKEDIKIWYPKVNTDGFLCGHDYADSPIEENGLVEFGVKKAVDEFINKNNLKLEIVYDGNFVKTNKPIYSWFIRKT